jgi:hypothetical protein
MRNPVRLRESPDAAQQARERFHDLLIYRGAAKALWRATAIALMGLVLLGATPKVREFDISIQSRQVQGGETLRVTRGEVVLMRWRTDEQVSVHVHGYDIQAKVSPGTPTIVRFVATVAGRFPIEAHQFGSAADKDSPQKRHQELTLLYLEVLPE